MSSTNPHTGDKQQTKTPTDKYRDGWDAIFGKKKEEKKEK
jgi:hypothetical protein